MIAPLRDRIAVLNCGSLVLILQLFASKFARDLVGKMVIQCSFAHCKAQLSKTCIPGPSKGCQMDGTRVPLYQPFRSLRVLNTDPWRVIDQLKDQCSLVAEPTHLKNSSNWIISPSLGVKIKQHLKPPPRLEYFA